MEVAILGLMEGWLAGLVSKPAAASDKSAVAEGAHFR